MRKTQRRWTFLVVSAWVLAVALGMVLAPTPADARADHFGWMVYTPNHPNGCAPLPYDCYVIWVWPD
jgi:hypothetical protein